ncbi:MAG: Nif3-like dinuclear metal center hexameric protein [Neisseria sp.]|nr:Nif3-like dinuclear metal center hexameric protein [Neisseria sp.]
MTTREEILAWCGGTLQTAQYQDYAPNGLQVEGVCEIKKITTAVTASLAAIEHAAQTGAQMLLVHHGLFWKSEPVTITGWKKQRIAALLRHGINLAGYHLPLDAHPELGNNARLAALLDWRTERTCGEQGLLHLGRPNTPKPLAELAREIEHKLGRAPTVIGDPGQIPHKAAWCSGGAQGFFQTAIDQGAQVYLTGEISEAQYHLAKETGVSFISAGHHATERGGIQALGQALGQHFGIETDFFDEENPA